MLSHKWTILGGLGLLWLVLTIIYGSFFVTASETTTRATETAKFALLSISAFGVLFSALLTSFNSLEATENVRQRTEFDRGENAFEYIRRWESETLRTARDFTREIGKEHRNLSQVQLLARIKGDERLERSVIAVFNFFEELSLAIEEERVREKVVKDAFAIIYRTIHTRFAPWLEKQDETTQGHLEHLIKRWN